MVYKTLVLLSLIFLIFFVGSISSDSFAHRDGCHRWHSCPSDTGSYVCGDLGYKDYCPDRQGIFP